ncbi:hypothetical protein HPP92_003049 [Vanilla planifolia]|uniref:Uncharacterized protein n=1 Tax=Vanilla planifolia TaxID=51239 RepID=A0A835RWY9_VANPL|nr:hypothetical protein HPP92_003049 [Vanilla planifolia]
MSDKALGQNGVEKRRVSWIERPFSPSLFAEGEKRPRAHGPCLHEGRVKCWLQAFSFYGSAGGGIKEVMEEQSAF